MIGITRSENSDGIIFSVAIRILGYERFCHCCQLIPCSRNFQPKVFQPVLADPHFVHFSYHHTRSRNRHHFSLVIGDTFSQFLTAGFHIAFQGIRCIILIILVQRLNHVIFQKCSVLCCIHIHQFRNCITSDTQIHFFIIIRR